MMKYSNYIGALAAISLIASCFMPWVFIERGNISVSGFQTTGTGFGKPAIISVFVAALALPLFLIPRIWAKRMNLFVCAFSIAWTLRNYILVTGCHGGDCPVKEAGIYLLFISGSIMMLCALFPYMPMKQKNPVS
jgi:hypothetical protein